MTQTRRRHGEAGWAANHMTGSHNGNGDTEKAMGRMVYELRDASHPQTPGGRPGTACRGKQPGLRPRRPREQSLLLQLPAGSVPAAQGPERSEPQEGCGGCWRVGGDASICPDSHAGGQSVPPRRGERGTPSEMHARF